MLGRLTAERLRAATTELIVANRCTGLAIEAVERHRSEVLQTLSP